MTTPTTPFAPPTPSLGRSPARLLRPERLALLPPTRLSASRALVHRMTRQRWRVECLEFDIDAGSRGRARYRVHTPSGPFDFVAFSFAPRLEGRTSRIVGTDWDMTGALFDGTADAADLEHTRRELPKLYAGRATAHTLVWCRSNRSLRLFEHVVDALATGRQPDARRLWDVGYLMRNTGLDGNGTFGTRSFAALPGNHPLAAPLHAQMLAAYLMREFAADLAEHLARHRGPDAVPLDAELRRGLGLGNASALGLVFFTGNHPRLVDRWLALREQALTRALYARRGAPHLTAIRDRVERTVRFHEQDPTVYGVFGSPTGLGISLRRALEQLDALAEPAADDALPRLWTRWNAELDEAAVEALAGVLIDSVPDLTDPLVDEQRVDETLTARPEEPVAALLAHLEDAYGWALGTDLTAPGALRHVWYKSRAAEEPRRGPGEEVTEGLDWQLNLPRALQALARDLRAADPRESVGVFRVRHPEHRDTVTRVQGLAGTALHSPHMNTADDAFLPVHIVRFLNAAVHGLDKTADSAGRNVLGLLFHGAPTRHTPPGDHGTDWELPARPAAAAHDEEHA
ncbi:hypothetical protein [Streptomyces sp. CRN 30]|uniref:hypothetical protein n=1 Tax=Streptomyces sp. CRN 30 TaxID=3075613 RepID=UPI002A8236B5|nr:hypothetical protein [Streptomyces sp. CRN 30]